MKETRNPKAQPQPLEGTHRRQVEERELPDPSSVWSTAAFFFLACAVGTVTAALSLSPDAAVSSSAFWITTPWLILNAGLCALAHLDVNRGRKARRYEVQESLTGDQQAAN